MILSLPEGKKEYSVLFPNALNDPIEVCRIRGISGELTRKIVSTGKAIDL
jgi:hypothetical protein